MCTEAVTPNLRPYCSICVDEQRKTSTAESVPQARPKAGTSRIQVRSVTIQTSLLIKIWHTVHNFYVSEFCISSLLFDLWNYR
jgi:hypothetical protein